MMEYGYLCIGNIQWEQTLLGRMSVSIRDFLVNNLVDPSLETVEFLLPSSPRDLITETTIVGPFSEA